MKHLKLMIPALMILAASFTSCKKHLFNSIKGKGEKVTETRNLSGFNKISFSIDGDLSYVQDSVYFIEITAQQNVLEVITTEMDGGTLRIDSDKWIRKHNGIKIIVHSPHMYAFDLSGSGNIESSSAILTSQLDLDISGSGNIALASVQADQLEVKISGSGNITVSGGVATNQKATVSGSGDIDMLGLTANYSDAKISGSGSVTVWVLDQLNANISGSGNVKYKGNPLVNTSISGSGSVIHV
jgi:hypothetical protein